jgi:mRNA-degrading endonuclease RelE of RelBE toxin-antitoxin system
MGSGKWTTKIERGAQRQLESLPRPDLVKEAAEIISDLADDPVPAGAIEMRGYNNMYRVRFGSDAYRIVYRADIKTRRIIVRAVGPRATVYRGMKRR